MEFRIAESALKKRRRVFTAIKVGGGGVLSPSHRGVACNVRSLLGLNHYDRNKTEWNNNILEKHKAQVNLLKG